jgi:hypothetical protein
MSLNGRTVRCRRVSPSAVTVREFILLGEVADQTRQRQEGKSH